MDDKNEKDRDTQPQARTSFFPFIFCRFPETSPNCLNPGSISNLHKKVRDLTPEWIEGFKLRCVKNLGVDKTIHGEWVMGNNTPIGVRLGGMACKKLSESMTVSSCLSKGCGMQRRIKSCLLLEIACACRLHQPKLASNESSFLVPSKAAIQNRNQTSNWRISLRFWLLQFCWAFRVLGEEFNSFTHVLQPEI
jgi:hypothetical protein